MTEYIDIPIIFIHSTFKALQICFFSILILLHVNQNAQISSYVIAYDNQPDAIRSQSHIMSYGGVVTRTISPKISYTVVTLTRQSNLMENYYYSIHRYIA